MCLTLEPKVPHACALKIRSCKDKPGTVTSVVQGWMEEWQLLHGWKSSSQQLEILTHTLGPQPSLF